MVTKAGLVWRDIHWPRPLEPERVVAVLRQWAADQRSPKVVLEVRATPNGVYYAIGAHPSALPQLTASLGLLVPGTVLVQPAGPRESVLVACRLTASTRHRALRTDDSISVVRALLTALSYVRDGEQLVLHIVLGPRRIPLAVSTHSPSSVVAPLWQIIWHGNGGQLDSEKRTALRHKVGDHGFACTVRLGVSAPTAERRALLLIGLMAAVRTSEAPGCGCGS